MSTYDLLTVLLTVVFILEVFFIGGSLFYYLKGKKVAKSIWNNPPVDFSEEARKKFVEQANSKRNLMLSYRKKGLKCNLGVFSLATILNIVVLITDHHFYSLLFAGLMLYFFIDTYKDLVNMDA